jgi:hypothetical protein
VFGVFQGGIIRVKYNLPSVEAAMEDVDKLRFDLLLNEKDHVDGQISSFLDLQIKILTFLFAALAAAFGWIFRDGATASPNEAKALILVGTAISACFGILLSIGTYAAAQAYIYYKTVVLGATFQEILRLREPPFATRLWSQSPGGKVLSVATGLLWLLVFLFTVWLLAAAWYFGTKLAHVLVLISVALLMLTLGAAALLARSIRITGTLPK